MKKMLIDFFNGFKDYFLVAFAIIVASFFAERRGEQKQQLNDQKKNIDEISKSKKNERAWNNYSDDDKLKWMRDQFPADRK